MRMLSTSLRVSKFSSPISTFMWPLAFVHPPWASSTLWGSGGSGADTLWGSGSFRCTYSVMFRRVPVQRFRRVPVQIPCEFPEVSGAATWWGSGGSRWRCVVRFRRVSGQIPCEVPEGSGADNCEVPGGSGADALWNLKGFRCFFIA